MKVGNQVQKNGGNVASHFLTPGGRLIHSVTGPVSASVLMDEAKWAIQMYQEAMKKPFTQRADYIATTHQQASMQPISHQDRKVHELLMKRPMPKLVDVYCEIFENILGQRVSRAAPRLAEAEQRLKLAKRTGRPLLFVLHEGNTFSHQPFPTTTEKLVEEYIVIVMPVREAPALSQLTKQPPYEANGSARPLFVVTSSDCTQIASVSGWKGPELTRMLAMGWVDALEKRPPSVRALVRAQRLLRPADADAAERVRELTIRIQQEAKEKREQRGPAVAGGNAPANRPS